MTNFIKPGNVLTFTAPGGGVVSGTPVLIGSIVVVPATSAAAGASFEGAVEGVFTLPKTTGATWSEGQVLYFDSATSSFATAQSATARRAGFAAAAAASPDASGSVRLLNIAAAVSVA